MKITVINKSPKSEFSAAMGMPMGHLAANRRVIPAAGNLDGRTLDLEVLEHGPFGLHKAYPP